jgi:hypothetical protein
MDRRKRYKINELPEEIIEAVNRQVASGKVGYREIADWINQLEVKGDDGETITVGKSSVQRYSKEFLAKMDRMRIISEQAKALVEANPDAPDTVLVTAANKLAVSVILETLTAAQGAIQGEKMTDVMKALAHLQRATATTEKLRLDYLKKASAAVEEIEAKARTKGIDPETLAFIKEQIYGIV